MKTIQQVKDEFRRRGVTVAAWSRKNGFSRREVDRVLSGETKSLYGKGHAVAVKLGLKDGEIIEEN